MPKKNNKEVSGSLNALAKTSVIVFIGLILSKVLSYFYRFIAARAYGPDAYGLFSLALVISGWFIAVATLGLSDGLLRYISLYRGKNNQKKINYLFKFSIVILSATSIIAGILMFVSAGWVSTYVFHDARLIIFLQIFSLSVPLTVMATPLLMSIRAYEKINAYSGIFNILQNVVKVALLIILVSVGIGSQSISISYISGLLAVVVAAYWYLSKKMPEIMHRRDIKTKEKIDIRREVLSFSWPLMFYSILSTILYWIDSFSIGYFKDAAAVGLYNAAVPIALLLTFAPELFTQLFIPMINRYHAAGKHKTIEELSKQMTKWIIAFNLPVFIAMIMFPGAIINVLFGAEYLGASTALRILAISALLNSLGVVATSLLSMSGKSKTVLVNIFIAAFANFVLNIFLVPMKNVWFIENSLGINGAAISTLLSMILFNILFFAQAYRHTGIIPVRRKILNVIAAAIIPTVTIILFHVWKPSSSILFLSAIGIVFILVYWLCLVLFNAFDSHDNEIIEKAKSKIPFLSSGVARGDI